MVALSAVVACRPSGPKWAPTHASARSGVGAPTTASTERVADPPPENPPPRAANVGPSRFADSGPFNKKEALILIKGYWDVQGAEQLVALGARLLPAFEEILNDPTIPENEQRTVLAFLIEIECDRTRFLGHAVQRLDSKSGDLRRTAVAFIGEAGSQRDASLVTVLLLDRDTTVRLEAARTLAKIGGEREVVVFELILKNANRYEEDGKLILNNFDIEDFEKYRDELKARLKKQAEEKAKPAPLPEKK